MSMLVVAILEQHGTVDPDLLARAFVAHWRADPDRGYGLGASTLFQRVNAGGHGASKPAPVPRQRVLR